MKCEQCEREAVIHITEIRRGLSSERHLCEKCADVLLPLEESDYSSYLELLPPRHATQDADGPEPTQSEMEMTGVLQHVFVVDLSTGARERVGLKSGDTFSPTWSPDGTHLALCHAAELRPSLVIAHPGSPDLRRFLHTTFAEPPSWSADGLRAAFSHMDEGSRIAVVERSGTEIRHLDPEDGVNDFLPVWSPADDRVAFVRLRVDEDGGEPQECSLMTARVDGGPGLSAMKLCDALVIAMGWSADGRFLAAQTIPFADAEPEDFVDASAEQNLYLMRPDQGQAAGDPFLRGCLCFAWFARVEGFGSGPVLAVVETARSGSCEARMLLADPVTGRRASAVENLVFPGGGIQPGHLARDARTLAAVRRDDLRRIVLTDLANQTARDLDAQGDVAWLGWRPLSDDLAALVRTNAGARLDLLSPDGGRRTIAAFDRREFFDIPLAALSPDGARAAVEVHVAKR